ncbi:MAG: acetate--CoA ligase [Deltaproteobacteria bacterium]|nr:acetate--CoA ligase [Deltaproteobacteria bacterium]MBI2974411.1 acetate--CoA ligase [Deltaproteobacteria bacterium]
MSLENRKFDPPKELSKNAWIKNFDEYKKMYDRSVKDPEGFWGDIAKEFHWYKPWKKVRSYDFKNKIDIKYFEGGKTNMSFNCLDRQIENGRGDRVAIIWEGNEPNQSKKITYKELYTEVCKFANVLREKGVKKGDRVSIYLPMILELPIAMLACARIGAIHSVVFGGFSADSLRDRTLDCGCAFMITCDEAFRGSKKIPMKTTADASMEACEKAGHPVKTCIVYKHADGNVPMKAGRDFWWHDVVKNASADCKPEEMDAEDPLFILYTSGSTGKPKGVLHTTGGYMVYTATTFKYIFDYHDSDVFWCTADIGWVTGHTYIAYGPLLCGATEVMFEGIPNYPHPDRFWDVCERHGVTIFYTAPTAIRALMREGEEWPKKHNLKKLRILGSVGEPINPEAWIWYYNNVGGERCPIVDTWWQTETGGILITPLPGAIPTKPGSATVPFFGVVPKIFNEQGKEVGTNEGGYLVITEPWPGIMRTVYGQHERFKDTYFVRFPGVYLTGDGSRKDEDGYFWLMGRIDDVLNVSGHRIGTAEVESALVSHPKVAESAVVGMPHEIKGQGIYAYVTLKSGNHPSDDLKKELVGHVRKEIGPIACPDKIHFTDSLPKTRSGKIMRRILRKIAEGDITNLGDTTTLADPSVVNTLVEGRQ